MFPAGWSSEFVFWWTNTQFPGEARRRSAHSGSSLPFKLRRKSPCQRSVSDSGRPRGLDLDAGGEASSRAAAPNLGRLQKHSHAVTTQPLGINWTGLTLLLPPLRLLHWFLKIIGANWLLDAAVGNTLCSVLARPLSLKVCTSNGLSHFLQFYRFDRSGGRILVFCIFQIRHVRYVSPKTFKYRFMFLPGLGILARLLLIYVFSRSCFEDSWWLIVPCVRQVLRLRCLELRYVVVSIPDRTGSKALSPLTLVVALVCVRCAIWVSYI